MTGRSAERLALEFGDGRPEEAAAQHRYAQGALPAVQPGRQPGQGAAGPAGHGRHIGVPAQLPPQRCAALCGQGVAAALRDHLHVPEQAQQPLQDLG
ncbi:hypothetical protein Smic_56070 [Streptomyces microflavus]|uniref:Uncharacterized protein n=1 Tax=Streptomyces microflavus TaxID=1919 RepID=A0A7J0CWZ6_STRMI|nr:hypothetical protein Smic_56070 [Streptomyces microflavus]